MKNLFMILLLLCNFFLLTACGEKISAGEKVMEFLDKYKNNDIVVMKELDEYIANEEINEKQEQVYKNIFLKQYEALNYEILSETYDGNNCKVLTKISVIDLVKAQKSAVIYLNEHVDEFKNDSGVYDREIFLDYKLEKMAQSSDMIDYTIEFNLVNENGKWELKQLTNDELEKIHGIYDYEG